MHKMEMEKTKLDTAIDSLNISAVYILDTTTKRKNGISPLKYSDKMFIQSFNGTESCHLAVFDNEDDDIYKYRYTYIYTVGMRLLDKNKEVDDIKDEDALAQIEANFEAIYLSDTELDNDCINEFGNNNVQFHVWPFWREFVQNSCMRMGVDPIPVPFYSPKNGKKTPNK